MLLNLTEFFQTVGKTEAMTLPYEVSKLPGKNKANKFLSNEPVKLTITNKEKGLISVSGESEVLVSLPCDRCLKPTKTVIEIAFEREVYAPERVDEVPDQADDQQFMDEYTMDLDILMQEELVINWNPNVLCKEDCKGLCKKCGHNLNEGECGCDTFIPDPRWAGLADLFANSDPKNS